MELGVEHCRVDEWEQGLQYLAEAFEDGFPNETAAPIAASYLGYALIRFEGKTREGLALCQRAAEMEFYNPEILLNLSRAELEAGNREAAAEAIRRGQAIDPDHSGLIMQRVELGWRQPVVLRFLGRDHPLNRLLGRIRHYLRNRR